MITGWLAANSLSWAYGKLLDKPYNKHSGLKDKKKREQFIADYDERMRQQLESVGTDEEIDFGGLQAFVEQRLEQSIVECVLEDNLELRERKREQLYNDAYEAGNADNEKKQQWIKCYVNSLLGFIEAIASDCIDDSTKIYVNAAIDENHQKTEQRVANMERDLDDLKHQRESSPFIEMISVIGPKKESENEFHYLNRKIGFWGREEEINALDAFLEDQRKILFMSIVAPGGSGKSKLVYEFVKQHEDDCFWEMKYIGKYQIDRLLSFDDYAYPKNLVLIVDYAGLHAHKLGDWLNHLLSLSENAFPQKIRLILVERDRAVQIESMQLLPLWNRELLGDGEQREKLKRIWYHASCFGPMGELRPLSDDAIRKIMIQYANNHDRSLEDKEVDFLMKRLAQIDTLEGTPRPLFALLLVEAYVHRHDVNQWNTDAILEHCIARTEKHWKELCGDNTNLYTVVQSLVLYATATEGLDMDNIPDILKQASQQLDYLDDDSYAKLICGVNQEAEYENCIYPMEPDIVGEYYLLQSFIKASCRKERLRERISGYWLKTENFFNVFARCIYDYSMNPLIKGFIRENLDLLLPPDRNELEIEAHSRLLHIMLIKFRGKKNQDISSAKIKELYEKYPKNKVVINDYAASLMLEFQNHIHAIWEQEENVMKIRKLLSEDPDSYYVLAMYGKSLFNQISGYCQYLLRGNMPAEGEIKRRISQHYKELYGLVQKHSEHDLLKRSLDMATAIMKSYSMAKNSFDSDWENTLR